MPNFGWDRTREDQREYMDRVHNDATGLRNQVSVDTLPGGAGKLQPDWVTRFFNWYADWTQYYWAHRPKVGSRSAWPWAGPPLPDDDSSLLPADDTEWAETAAYEAALVTWAKQYEQLTGRLAQPHSPPLPPKSPANNLNVGLDMGGVGTAIGIGAAAAIVVLLVSR